MILEKTDNYSHPDDIKRHIFILDDDPHIVELTRTFLYYKGFQVTTAFTAQEGFDLIRKERPDLILLDIMLPDMNGNDLCRRLKANSALWHIPVIHFTALSDINDKVQGMASGADDYITKPFEPEELLARIKMVLQRTSNVLDANPLSRLPGNASIYQQIQKLLESENYFAICYLDIDHFKSFNDEYGFQMGDVVLKKVADLLVHIVLQMGNSEDFVGHVGGDDFVFTTSIEKVDMICQEVIKHFDEIIYPLYSEEIRQKGYIIQRSRVGRFNKTPLMSISIAVITNENKPLHHIAEINTLAADLKKYAKSKPGSNYVKDARSKPKRKLEKSETVLLPAHVFDEKREIADLISEKKINLFLRPIFSLKENKIVGYSAFIKGYGRYKTYNEIELFRKALDLGLVEEFCKIYLNKVKVFSYGLSEGLKIFFHVDIEIIKNLRREEPNFLQQLGLPSSILVIEFSELDLYHHTTDVLTLMDLFRKERFKIGLYDFHGAEICMRHLIRANLSYLRTSEDVMKTIPSEEEKIGYFRLLNGTCNLLHTKLVVSGVEEENTKGLLEKVDIDYVEGSLFDLLSTPSSSNT